MNRYLVISQIFTWQTDGELYRMNGYMMYRLYYQNPSPGFQFMRLIVERLRQEIARERATEAAG